jgi:hypothetical protein
VVPRENDSTARASDNTAVACGELPDGPETASDDHREPIVEADDREEAGYGYGV